MAKVSYYSPFPNINVVCASKQVSMQILIENSNIDVGGGTRVLKILFNVGVGQYLEK